MGRNPVLWLAWKIAKKEQRKRRKGLKAPSCTQGKKVVDSVCHYKQKDAILGGWEQEGGKVEGEASCDGGGVKEKKAKTQRAKGKIALSVEKGA